MVMAHSQHGWTLEMVHALPDDGNRYELIDGELFVTPAPTRRHQRAVSKLARLLEDFAEQQGLEVLFAPLGVPIAGGEVQPDIVVCPMVRGPQIPDVVDIAQLVLAVEVLSPGTKHRDRQAKRHLYQSNGVPEYWIVDLDARVVERWRPNDVAAEVLTTSFEWQPVAGVTLGIDVTAYFHRVLD
ncbi:MAG: Uma2 family endonuclease [Gemmatimonadaceae bacterium]